MVALRCEWLLLSGRRLPVELRARRCADEERAPAALDGGPACCEALASSPRKRSLATPPMARKPGQRPLPRVPPRLPPTMRMINLQRGLDVPLRGGPRRPPTKTTTMVAPIARLTNACRSGPACSGTQLHAQPATAARARTNLRRDRARCFRPNTDVAARA
jgi:hypothetical protein